MKCIHPKNIEGKKCDFTRARTGDFHGIIRFHDLLTIVNVVL